jgi:hypothetical protein
VRLTFDPAEHSYGIDGLTVPSVTQVLRGSGFGGGGGGNGAAMARGSAVHLACEFLDAGIDEPIDESLAGYIAAWENCKAEAGIEVVHSEMRVGHPRFLYAGTLDRIVRIEGQLAVLDLKTVTEFAVQHEWGLQVAAYREAYNYRRQEKASHSLVAMLRADGIYRLAEFNDHSPDFEMFRALLVVNQWNKKHGLA